MASFCKPVYKSNPFLYMNLYFEYEVANNCECERVSVSKGSQ